jgi:rhodanese-related sulfurtransferase
MKNLFSRLLGLTSEKGASMVQNGFPSNAKELIKNKQVVIVDVRETPELAEGMAAGAIHMPLSAVDEGGAQYKKFLSSLPKDKEIWFYCRSGGRSGKVSAKVASEGFSVRNVGGFSHWVAQGLPTK